MVIALKWLKKEQNLQDKRILLTEGSAEEQQLVIVQEKDGFHLCGDCNQFVQEEKFESI